MYHGVSHTSGVRGLGFERDTCITDVSHVYQYVSRIVILYHKSRELLIHVAQCIWGVSGCIGAVSLGRTVIHL